MLGYISVVKQKVKEGMTEEYVALVKGFGIDGIKVARRREFIEIDEHNFIIIMEYDDIASLVDAQGALVSNLDKVRHLLVEIDDEGNVTAPASGTLIFRERRADA